VGRGLDKPVPGRFRQNVLVAHFVTAGARNEIDELAASQEGPVTFVTAGPEWLRKIHRAGRKSEKTQGLKPRLFKSLIGTTEEAAEKLIKFAKYPKTFPQRLKPGRFQWTVQPGT
jgi:hypothetical protein